MSELRYVAESGGYSVFRDDEFIGRVRRWRYSYSWGAYPVVGRGTDCYRTRAEAIRALEQAAPPSRRGADAREG